MKKMNSKNQTNHHVAEFDLETFLENSNKRYKFWEQSRADTEEFFKEEKPELLPAGAEVTAEEAGEITINAGYVHCFLETYGTPSDYIDKEIGDGK